MEFKNIVRIICVDELNCVDINCLENLIEKNCVIGTGFFIDKNKIITADHLINTYYEGDRIYVNPINLEDKNIYEARVITKKNESQIAILELDIEFEVDRVLLVKNYNIKPQEDQWSTMGHPAVKWNNGLIQKGCISRLMNKLNSYNADLDLEIYGDRISDFSGISGSPLIIKDMVVGVIIQQAEENGKAISIGAISVNCFFSTIPEKYILDFYNITPKVIDDIEKVKINNIPFKKNINFIGRETKIQELKDKIEQIGIQVLTGMSGVGKTQLAIEYVYENEECYNYIFWIRSDTNSNLYHDYRAIGESVSVINDNDKDYEKCIKTVNKWLKDNNNWLIIFDNCEEYNQIESYIPHNKIGHIIITSKNPNWNKISNPIKLIGFTDKEAVKFLMKRTNIENDGYAEDLAYKLGYLPLALNQAASYIEENSINFKEYLELYKQYNLTIFDKNYDEKDYEYTVKNVWKISLEKIEKDMVFCIKLIKLLSIFSNEKIPNWIIKGEYNNLINIIGEDNEIIDYNKAISILKKYSLIECTDKYIYMHCLVQNVIQDDIKLNDNFNDYVEMVSKFIYTLLPSDLEASNKWRYVDDLIPHAKYVIEKININSESYAELLYKLAVSLRVKYDLEQAETFTRKAFEIYKELYGEKHDKVFKILNLLAGIMKDKGMLCEARNYYSKILDYKMSQENEDDPNLPIIMNNLALIAFEEGKDEEAKKFFNEALDLYKKELELNIGFISTTLSNLSIVNVNLENYEKAQKDIDEALELAKKAYGENSIQYSRALNNKGNIFLNLKMYGEAKKYFELSSKIDEEFYGDVHPEVLKKKNNLAICLLNEKQNVEVKQLLESIVTSIKDDEIINSKSYPNILETLSEAYIYEEKYEIAIKYLKDAESILTKKYGNLNFKVSEIKKNIARCMLNISLEDAYNLYVSILEIDKKICDKDNQYIIQEDLFIIGKILVQNEEYKKSVSYIKEALQLSCIIYGDNSNEVSKCLSLLSIAYFNMGNYDKAYSYENRALNINLSYFHKQSEEVAMNYNNLAHILHTIGNRSKSQELINQAIDIVNKNMDISQDSIKVIKDTFYRIMNIYNNNIFDTLEKYKIQLIQQGDTLIINPIKKC